MTVLAHIGGVPVEEALSSLGAFGGAMLVARGWLTLRLRRGSDAPPPADRPARR